MKLRYTICAVIIAACGANTPWAIEYAYRMRGYFAIGGEYMIIPLGIVSSCIILSIAKKIESYRERYADYECKKANSLRAEVLG